MPKTSVTSPFTESRLHGLLRDSYAAGNEGKINLHQRFWDIKEKAHEWLKPLGKNGYEHSERLEGYLDDLTEGLIEKGSISPAEIFVLLCAVYMHDVGYWYNGEPVAKGHPERSREYILNDPSKYLLDDFPPFTGNHPRVAEAVGWVAHGHSEDRFLPLKEIPNNFPDQALSKAPLNLRMLSALLRMADEADDPYIRVKGDKTPSIRSGTPLVRIGTEIIAWHWKHAGVQEPDAFVEHLNEKTWILVSTVDYLRDMGAGNWYLVLDPQVAGTVPDMAEKPVDTFVGREPDLEALHTIIKDRRAGAITGVAGTGGIGKTELARMYAETYRLEYPSGIFWASLKGSDWKSEAQRILATIRPGADPMVFPDAAIAKENVGKALNRKGALLIIDNVNEADDIITPECSVLVTTRNKGAFGILPKESIYSLERFDEGEGLDLLKKVLGESRVNKDPKGALRLVEVLGGMPLAIEIAAKHLNDTPDITFPQYIGWVRGKVERLKLEDDPDKDVIASLTLSLDLLEKEDRGDVLLALFEAASVCAESGFTSLVLGSAAGFGDKDRMILQQLVGKLHNRSLLEYSDEAGRYSLHPLVRQMSESGLKADKKRDREYRKNHCTYFLHYARAYDNSPSDLIREKDGVWLGMVQAIQVGWEGERLPIFIECLSKPFRKYLNDNEYETAFSYLIASNLINIHELGRSRELVDLLEPLFERKTRFEDSSLLWVLNSLGVAYAELGEYRKAIELYEQALEIHRWIGDVRGEGSDLGNIGVAYAELGEYRKAIEFYEQALEIARRVEDVRGEGNELSNMGSAYMQLEEYRKAIEFYEQGLKIHRRIGDVRDEGTDLGNMGVAYTYLGEYFQAFELYEQALEIHRRIGDVRGEGNVLGNMGLAYDNLGGYRKAIEHYEQALEIHRRIGDVRGEGNALGKMGVAFANLREYRKAIELYEQALEIHRRIGDVKGEGIGLGNMGVAFANLREYRKAIELYEQALEIHRRIGDVRGEGNGLGIMGFAYMRLGEYRKAIELYEQALEIHRRIGDVRREGTALGNMGLAYADLGEDKKAWESFKGALLLFKRLNLPQVVNQVRQMARSKGIEI